MIGATDLVRRYFEENPKDSLTRSDLHKEIGKRKLTLDQVISAVAYLYRRGELSREETSCGTFYFLASREVTTPNHVIFPTKQLESLHRRMLELLDVVELAVDEIAELKQAMRGER